MESSPLLRAAANKNKEIVEYLINDGANINCSDGKRNYTVLHYVSRNGWLDVVQTLLNKGADIQAKTASGNTAILLAAHHEQEDIVEFLMNAGADVKCSGIWDNYTLLHYAAVKGWFGIVQSLLRKGVDIDVKTDCGESALLLAAQNRHKYIVEFLIEKGADIDCCSEWDNYTVLHYSSQYGWLGNVLTLLKKGADIQVKTKKGVSPLYLAAVNGHEHIVLRLISARAGVNFSYDSNDLNVLRFASTNGWFDVVYLLLSEVRDIQEMTKGSQSPVLLAAQNGHQDIVKLLIVVGADINCCDARKRTVLHIAASNGWIDIIQCLLNKDADIEVKTYTEETPLYLAAKYKQKDIVELLINAGANINSTSSYNYTVLHFAARNGWLQIVQSLLKMGANIEAKSSWRESSLQIACDYQKIEIVEHLISAGADVNVECTDGHSPLSSSIKSSDIEFVRLLIENGSYLKYTDYESMKENPLLKEHILKDVKLCSQAIVNEFNYKDLPKLYKLCMACKILPNIEGMRIGSQSEVKKEVLRSVKQDIESKGHCNLFSVRPCILKILTVKSFLGYCDSIKQQTCVLNNKNLLNLIRKDLMLSKIVF